MIKTRGPLAGIRVIEVASFVAGPLAGMTLGQLGADVIRVDPIGGAADSGRWPITESGASIFWNGLNKGKRSAAIDLRGDEGRELVHQLVRSSDAGTCVVLTNIGGQSWLSYETLRGLCPDLIYVSIEGKSDGSPGVDYTINAAAGFPLVTGPENMTDPVNHVVPVWDISCGLYAALGVSAAARERAISGEGAEIRIALDDVALAFAGNLGFLGEAQVNGVSRRRVGNYLYGTYARDFRCADGQSIMLVALTPRHWRDLLRVTEAEPVVAALENSLNADFTREGDRYTYRSVLSALFERWFSARTRPEAESALATTSCLWEPYRSFIDIVQELESGQAITSIVDTIDQPGMGRYLATGLPMRIQPRPPVLPSPLLGEHTRDVLRDALGIEDVAYGRLRDAGVVADDVGLRLRTNSH